MAAAAAAALREILHGCAWDNASGLVDEELFVQFQRGSLGPEYSLTRWSAVIHQRAVLDAVNEVLADADWRAGPGMGARAARPGSTAASRRFLSEEPQCTAAGDSFEDTLSHILQQLPSSGLVLLPSQQSDDSTSVLAAEDVGAAVRAHWRRLAPKWRHFSEGESHRDISCKRDASSSHTQTGGERALAHFWQGRAELLLSNAEIHEELWRALCANISPPWAAASDLAIAAARRASRRKAHARNGSHDDAEADNGRKNEDYGDDDLDVEVAQLRINYEDWLAAIKQLPSHKTELFRSARLFLSLQLDCFGRVAVRSLYAAVASLSQLLETRVLLSEVERPNSRRLLEPELETFVQDLIGRLPGLRSHVHLQQGHSFVPFYLAHCTRKLLLLLEPGHHRGVNVEELLESEVLAELFEHAGEEPLGEERDRANWFSLQTAIHVYRQFLELDLDHDGMLTPFELQGIGAGANMALTPTFCSRLFQVVNTYDGKLDYKGYLDLVLALEHRSTPAGQRYFWRALDLDCRGSVGAFELRYFLRDIMAELRDSGAEPIAIENVVGEIIDLVKVSPLQWRRGSATAAERHTEHGRFTLRELSASGAGSIVIAMLVDVHGFWSWDNRESLVEYDNCDRFAVDAERAAQRTTALFSCAARRLQLLPTPPALHAIADGQESERRLDTNAPSSVQEAEWLGRSRSLALLQRAEALATLPSSAPLPPPRVALAWQDETSEEPKADSAIPTLDALAESKQSVDSCVVQLDDKLNVKKGQADAPGRKLATNADMAEGYHDQESKSTPESGRRRRTLKTSEEVVLAHPSPLEESPLVDAPRGRWCADRASPRHTVIAAMADIDCGTAAVLSPHRNDVTQPAILDEFSVDDVLLWLEAVAFRRRPCRIPGGSEGCRHSAAAAHRERISLEIQELSLRGD